MAKISQVDWLAPSGVDSAVAAYFCGPSQRNLVVARASLLQVYVLRDQDITSSHSSGTPVMQPSLALVKEVNLKGNIVSLAPVRLPARSCDSLLVSFGDARASVLHWDHASNDIRVESLHFYENDEQLRDGHMRILFSPKVVVSERRCAAMVVYDQHLAVLPLQRLPVENGRQYTEEELSKRFPSSYTIPLSELDVKNVRDICFLEGFYLPTLLILYEPHPSAFNRTSEKTMTCKCIAIALDVANRKHSLVWSRDSLPYDSVSISSVPSPVGGAAILTPNSFIYLNARDSVGLTLNHFGDKLPYKFRTRKSARVLVIDSPQIAWLSSSRALVVSKSGEMNLFELVNDGTSVSDIRLLRAGQSVAPTSVCVLGRPTEEDEVVGALVFVASRTDDSILLRIEKRSEEEMAAEKAAAEAVKIEVDTVPNEPVDEMVIEANEGTDGNPHEALEVAADGALEEAEDEPPRKVAKIEDPVIVSLTNGGAVPSQAAPPDPTPVDTEPSLWDSIAEDEMLGEDDRSLLDFFKQRARDLTLADKALEYKSVEIDRLLSCGPVSDFVAIPSFDEASTSKIDTTDKKEFQKQSRKLVDLVMSVGSEKSGALIVAQQSLRPHIRVNFAVPGLEAAWSVGRQDSDSAFHRFVLLSRGDSTLVLESGESLQEITNTAEFITDAPTIAAGTVLHNSLVVQVHPRGVVLMDGPERVADWSVTDKSLELKRAQILDPYIVVQLQNSALILLEAKTQQGEVRLSVCNVTLNDSGVAVTAFALFKDTSRRPLFNYSKGHETISHKRKHTALSGSVADLSFDPSDDRTLDPEERELYHSSASTTAAVEDESEFLDAMLLAESEVQRPHYIAIALETGAMQILRFTSTSARQVFLVNQFSNFSTVLANEMERSLEKKAAATASDHPPVVELFMATLGDSFHAPHLFALAADGVVAVYEVFASPAVTHQSLPIRLHRIEAPVQHTVKPNVRDFPQFKDPDDRFSVVSSVPITANGLYRPRFIPFDNLRDGQRGVFVCGEKPFWALSSREALRFFPMTSEGHVNAFAPFHNSSNEFGFIFHCVSEGKVKIAQLPHDSRFELSLLTRRIPIGRTIHSVVFDAPTSLLCVMTSYKVVDMSHYYQVDLANNASAEEPKPENSITDLPLPDRLPDLPEERFELYLVNPEDWKILDKYLLAEEEHVLSMKVVHLKVKEGEKTVLEPLIALGTAHVRGEDQPVLGNIRLLDVLRPQDVSASGFNVVVTAEQRGPVACVGHVEGVLIACIGMKILLFSFFNRTELIGCAFFDCQIQIVSVVSLKNYILLADVLKSVCFLRWREDVKQLELLGKDYDSRSVFTTDFFVDGDKLSILLTDDEKNLHVFKYDPIDNESRGGQKLICTGNYHLGTHVNRMLRVKTNVLKTNRQAPIARYCNVFASLDGGVGSFSPIDDEAFEKFGRLEMRMVSALSHPAGLNPKAFRLSRSWQSLTQNRVRSVLDLSLLKRFASLDRGTQSRLAGLVGLDVAQIYDFLLDNELRTLLF